MAVQEIITTMAQDLKIRRYNLEPETQFTNRVIYSAMSCWIKASALDKSTIGMSSPGISKIHISKKCSRVLEEILSRCTNSLEWFKIKDEDDPISIIRQRLLNSGDLINVGYDNNVGLPVKQEINLGFGIQQLIGCIHEVKYIYSGIALVSPSSCEFKEPLIVSADEWLKNFIKNAWWKAGSCIDDETEFFNAEHHSVNNYSCWILDKVSTMHSIILTRHPLHNQAYEYVLEKEEHGTHYYHRLDPFNQEIHEYRRFMFALRTLANNPVKIKAVIRDDYIQLSLRTLLPDKEQIMLETFAWPHETIIDKLNYDIPSFVWPYLRVNLVKMGAKIMEEQHG